MILLFEDIIEKNELKHLSNFNQKSKEYLK